MTASSSSQEQWETVRSTLRSEVGDATFASWIAPLSLDSVNQDVATLAAPSKFVCDRVQSAYGAKIKQALRRTNPDIRRVVYAVTGAAAASDQPVSEAVAPRRAHVTGSVPGERAHVIGQGPGRPRANKERRAASESTGATPTTPLSANVADRLTSITLNDRFSFDRFVVGRPNDFAFSAAKRIAESETTPFNPLFLYGQCGLGKTHLLHAIAWRRKELFPNDNIMFISAETFLMEFVDAVRRQNTYSFKELLRNVDMLLVDDVQHIFGKNYTQEEFFHTFNALADQSKQIVLSADRSPSEIDQLDERLRSRLGSGLVADIHPTDYELRFGILSAKTEAALARTPGVEIDRRVLDFLARRISSNVRILEGALNRLFAMSSMTGRVVTVEMAQRNLQDLLRDTDRRISVDEIQKTVAEYYNVRVSDLLSKCRAQSITRPRQVAIYLCKELTPKSTPYIGGKFNRDHTTVIHSVRKIKELITSDSELNDDVERLRRKLES